MRVLLWADELVDERRAHRVLPTLVHDAVVALERILPIRCDECLGSNLGPILPTKPPQYQDCPECDGGIVYPDPPAWWQDEMGWSDDSWRVMLRKVWRAMGIVEVE